jgi:hypothetical protein
MPWVCLNCVVTLCMEFRTAHNSCINNSLTWPSHSSLTYISMGHLTRHVVQLLETRHQNRETTEFESVMDITYSYGRGSIYICLL